MSISVGMLLALTVANSSAQPPETGLAAFGLSGTLALDYFSSDHAIDDRRHFPGLNLTVKHRRTLAEGVRWVAEGRVLAQQVGHEHQDSTSCASIRDLRYGDQVISELRESYVEVEHDQWEISAGRQIIVWGRADEINPTDVLSPKNFLLLLPEGQSAYRFGTTAVKVDYFAPYQLRATAVWQPFTSPSLIPLGEPPPGVQVHSRSPAIRFDNGMVGFKLDHSGGEVDASVAYAYGYNLLPEVQLTQLASDPVTGAGYAKVELINAHQHMVGVDFATTRGRFGLRGEVAYFDTDNPHGTQLDGVTPSLFYVLGIERGFPGDVSVIVQYVGRFVFARVDPARALGDPNPALGRARFLAARETFIINQQLDTVQNGWSLRIDKRFWNDTLDCELLGVHHFERNDFFLRPRVTYDLADGWRLGIGGEVFGGPQVSFFGRVKKNSGAFAEIVYSF